MATKLLEQIMSFNKSHSLSFVETILVSLLFLVVSGVLITETIVPNTSSAMPIEGMALTNGEQEITFKFTDDNINEDLLIYSDQETYGGWEGSKVYFAIDNTTNDHQNSHIRFLFSNDIAQVDNIAYLAPSGTWETLDISTETTPLPNAVKRKPVPENFTFTFGTDFELAKKGRTIFRAEISYPPRSEVGKFYIETFSNKGAYGLLDPYYSNTYKYRRSITVNSSQVATTTQRFAMLATTTLSDLRTEANGGKVEQSNGYDIIFVDDDNTTLLDFEMVTHDATTGSIQAWIETDISSTTDKTIYIYYGNPNASNQEDLTGVWNTDYLDVWHLENTSNSINFNTLSVGMEAAASSTGWIGGAYEFDGSDDYLRSTFNRDFVAHYSISAWAKPEIIDGTSNIIFGNRAETGGFPGFNATNLTLAGDGTDASYRYTASYTGGFCCGGFSVDSFTAPATNTWAWIVGVTDTLKGKHKIYVDGQLKYSTDILGADISNSAKFTIGAGTQSNQSGGQGYEWTGQIDEVIYTDEMAWTDADVLTQYNNQTCTSCFMTIGSEEVVIGGKVTNQALSVLSGITVSMAINGGNTFSVDTDASGSYAFATSSLSASDIILTWIDDETIKGATISATSTPATIMHIIQDYFITRLGTNGTELTNAMLNTADTGDADIPYTVTGNDIAFDSGINVAVPSGSTYQPGGSITEISNLTINSGGRLILENNDITNLRGHIALTGSLYTTSTITMTTSTASTQRVTSNGNAFHGLTVNATGSGTISAQDDLVTNGQFTVTAGTYNANDFDLTLRDNFAIGASGVFTKGTATTTFATTSATLTFTDSAGSQDLGNVVVDGTATTLSLASALITDNLSTGSDDILTAGGNDITVSGNYINNGTYTSGANTSTFDAGDTGGSDVYITTGQESPFNNLTVNQGSTTFYPTDTMNVSSTLNISSGILDLNGSNLNVDGTVNNDTELRLLGSETTSFATGFDTNSGTTTYTGTGNYTTGLAAGSAYNALAFTGSGTWAVSGTSQVNVSSTILIQDGLIDATLDTFYVDGNWINTGGQFFNPSGSAIFTNATGDVVNITTGDASAFNIINFSSSGTGTNFVLQDTLYASSSIIITSSILDANAQDIHAGLNWFYRGTAALSNFLPRGNTVYFTCDNPSTCSIESTSNNIPFYNVVINDDDASGQDTITVQGEPITISNDLTITDGVFDLDAANSITIGGNFTIGASGSQWLRHDEVLTFTGTTVFTDNSGTFDIGSFTISSSTAAATVTLGSNATSSAVTIESGETLDYSASNFEMLYQDDLTINGTINTRASTSTFATTTGSITYTDNAGNSDMHNVEVTGSGGTLTLADVLLTYHIVVNQGTTLNAGGNNILIDGNYTNNGTAIHSGNTVRFTTSGTNTVKTGEASPFYNFTLNSASVAVKLVDQLNVSSTISILQTGIVYTNDQNINVGGDFSIGASATFTKGTATTTFSGATPTFTDSSGAQDMGNIVINGSATNLTLASNLDTDNLTIATGNTLTSGSNTIAVAGNYINNGTAVHTNTVTFNGSGNQSVTTGDSSAFNALVLNTAASTIVLLDQLNASSTISSAAGNLDANDQNILAGANMIITGTFTKGTATTTLAGGTLFGCASDMGNLVIDGTATSITLAVGLTADNLTIGTDDGLASGNFDILISGNFVNNGTYSPGSNTTSFDDTGTQFITSNNYAFNDFTHSGTGTAIIQDTSTISGDLTNSAGTLEIDGLTTVTGDIANTATITEDASYIVKTASGSFGKTSYDQSSDSSVVISLTDKDENLDGTAIEAFNIALSASGLAIAEIETVTVTETGVATGIFTGSIAIGTNVPTVSNGTLDLTTGASGTISGSYTDSEDASDVIAFNASFGSSSGGGNNNGGGGGGGSVLLNATPVSQASIVINNGETFTNDPTVEVILSSVDVVEMAIGETPTLSGYSFQPYDESISWTFDSTDGEKILYAKFRKSDGVESPIVFDSITLDTTPPSQPFITTPIDGDRTSDRELLVVGNTEPLARIRLRLNGGAIHNIQADTEGKWTYLFSELLSGGTQTLSARAVDQAGNFSEPRTITFEVVSVLVLPDEPDRIPLPPGFPPILPPTTTPDTTTTTPGITTTSTPPVATTTTPDTTPTEPTDTTEPVAKGPSMIQKIGRGVVETFRNVVNGTGELIAKGIDRVDSAVTVIRRANPLKQFATAVLTGAKRATRVVVSPVVRIIEQPPVPNFEPLKLFARIMVNGFNAFIDKTATALARVVKPISDRLHEPALPNIQPANALGSIIGDSLDGITNRLATNYLKRLQTKDQTTEILIVTPPSNLEPIPSRIPLIAPNELAMISPFGNLDLTPAPGEKSTLPPGKRVNLYVRPDREVTSIKATMLFTTSLSIEPAEIPFIFIKQANAATPAYAKEYIVDETTYTDGDGDGIWETTIVLPVVGGDYAVETVIDYTDGADEVFKREFLIDPEGYVFRKAGNDEARLADVKVTLYKKHETHEGYYVWDAGRYDQKNPQYTDKTGEYSFLVPAGTYQIRAIKEGFKLYTSQDLIVTRNSPVHLNIELKKEGFFKFFD